MPCRLCCGRACARLTVRGLPRAPRYDAAKNRFATACAKVHKQGYSSNAGKVETERESMEDFERAMQKDQGE